MTDYCLVVSTAGSQQEAEKIAAGLVDSRLAACVNILPGATSIYRWQGQVERSGELVLLIKSRRDLLPQLERELARLHSYDTPELIVLPIEAGAARYLAWLGQELRPAEPAASGD